MKLSEPECWDHLGRRDIGRLLVTMRALPRVVPVRYAVRDDRIVVRLGDPGIPGSALAGIVALSVDQIDHEEGSGWAIEIVGRCTPMSDTDGHCQLAELDPVVVTGDRIALGRRG